MPVRSIEPEPRQRAPRSAPSTATRSRRKRGAVARAEPHHRDAVPGRNADLAAESVSQARAPSRRWRRRPARSGRSRRATAALADRRLARACAATSPSSRTRLGEDEPAVAAHAPAIDQLAVVDRSRPWRSGRTPSPRPAAASASSARSTSIVRVQPRAGRTGSSPAAASAAQPPAPTASRHVDRRVRVERAIDLLGRRGRDRRAARRARPRVEIEAVAARHAARGVDDHGLELAGRRSREAHAQRALLAHARAARRAAASARRRARCGRCARLAAKIAACPRRVQSPRITARSSRHRVEPRNDALRAPARGERRLVQVVAAARIDHRAAVHHDEMVAELARKIEILLDQHDRDLARGCADRRWRGRYP